MLDALRVGLFTAIEQVGGGVVSVTPKILIALVLIVLGFVFGSAVSRVISQLVEMTKVDALLKEGGVEEFFEKTGYKLNSGLFLGWLAKLFLVVIFLIAAFDVLGLTQVNAFLTQVLDYIPNVVVASFIIFIASVAADILAGIVAGATKAVGSRVAHLLESLTRWSIWLFAILIALSHLGIASQYMYALFTGFVAMLALAGGLAFGLGGKDAAAEIIREIRTEIREGKKKQ